jgi:hypothetical protein
MSAEFVQFNFPCKDCLVRAACKEKPKNESITHLYDNHSPRCLTVPKFPPDVAYIKGLLECWANLGVVLVSQGIKQETPYTSIETQKNISMTYMILISHMSNLLQWIVNSTSWRDGKIHDFDIDEIRSKCKLIMI